MNNLAVWFEIPVTDMGRAKQFYEQIFDIELNVEEMSGILMGFFPSEGYATTGALVFMDGCIPSENGTLVYLNGGHDLNVVLNRVENAGGKVVVSKTLIAEEIGYFGIFLDTEGNKLALHSQN